MKNLFLWDAVNSEGRHAEQTGYPAHSLNLTLSALNLLQILRGSSPDLTLHFPRNRLW